MTMPSTPHFVNQSKPTQRTIPQLQNRKVSGREMCLLGFPYANNDVDLTREAGQAEEAAVFLFRDKDSNPNRPIRSVKGNLRGGRNNNNNDELGPATIIK